MIKDLQEDIPFDPPNYAKPKPDHKETDRRLTLYWKPEIITNQEGEATISFYAADLPVDYKIVVESITLENIAHGDKQIKINQ